MRNRAIVESKDCDLQALIDDDEIVDPSWIVELVKTLDTYNADTKIGFPNTGYYLPVIYSLTGMKVETIEDLIEEGKKQFVIDMAKVGYIDSSGIGALISILSKLKNLSLCCY